MNSQQLESWADELLGEYKEERRDLGRMKNDLEPELFMDKKQINSMIDSMSFTIEWMETGRQPGLYRGIDKRNAYRLKQYEDMDIIPDINEELRKEREPFYLNASQKAKLINIFKSFSDRERQCYIMYEAENLSMKKIADRLGIKKRTVQQYIERAREKVEKVAS
ncbi:sigma factor-like helix-turn-helix DNA-binding protein [Oceanobacillus sp. Castelsardo]|uniref:sigma factor-like helix-turn-helix DNA-binding protein n=1 Tax=Oceanobacillus sp. Castelsardo TaxID=1851204 RepID=UPI000839AD54|nr:sigma factor-like helix-turn-helix DNA-binding protein [Oceanobacillus sp. Castelsardo]